MCQGLCLIIFPPSPCTSQPNINPGKTAVLRMLSCLGPATPKKEGAGGSPTTGRRGGQVIFQSSSRPEDPPSFKCTRLAWTLGGPTWIWRLGSHPQGSRHRISMGAPLLIDPPQLPRLCLSPALGPQSSSAPGMWLQPRWPLPEGSIVGTSLFIFLLSFSRFLSLFCLTFILDWSIVDLLCCVCLRWIAAWFNHAYIYFSWILFPCRILQCCVICNMYPMGYSGSFLMIYFMCVYIYIYVSVYMSVPTSLFILPTTFFLWLP